MTAAEPSPTLETWAAAWPDMARSSGVQVITDRRPGARARHGRVIWARLTPVQSLTMLAAMIEASADTVSPKASRHCTVTDIRARMRASLSAVAVTARGSTRAIDDAVVDLDRRGALRLYDGAGRRLDWWRLPRLLGEDVVYVDVWPVPGGAPW